MKKQLLLLFLGFSFSFGFSQNTEKTEYFDFTAALTDWLGMSFGNYVAPIFPDTSVSYVGAADQLIRVKYHSFGAMFDPTSVIFEVYGNKTDKYTSFYNMDTIVIPYLYVRSTSDQIVDTLVVHLFDEDHVSKMVMNNDPSKIFGTVMYDRKTADATNFNKEIRIPLTIQDTGYVWGGFKLLRIPVDDFKVSGIAAVTWTFKPGYSYALNDTLYSHSNNTKVYKGGNLFYSYIGADFYHYDLSSYNNGLLINYQMRYSDVMGSAYGSRYLPGSVFSAYWYPRVLFGISPAVICDFTTGVGFDSLQCYGKKIELSVKGNYQDFVWSNGSSGSSIEVFESGQYVAVYQDSVGQYGCDTFGINFYMRDYDIGEDMRLCEGDTANLFAPSGFNDFQWFDNSKDSVKHVTRSDDYQIILTDSSACVSYDTFHVEFYRPYVDLGPDDSIYSNEFISLEAGEHDAYLWHDGSSGKYFIADSNSLEYGVNEIFVTVYDTAGCSNSDTVYITMNVSSSLEEFKDLQVRIYPNPTRALLYIEGAVTGDASFSLIDGSGRILFAKRMDQSHMNVLDLGVYPEGVYILQLRIGDEIRNTKIIKRP